MNRIAAVMLGVLPILAASAAYAQSQVPQTGGTVKAPPVVYPGELSQPANPVPQALFSIGRLPVGVWAPVAPTYDATANGTGATNPFWAGTSWATTAPPG
jgi:hypothetical protein